jgi:GTPase SAR1 family protein
LIIGNANAGKTTILEKVCHAMGREPESFNAEGKKVGAVLFNLKGTSDRGLITVFFLLV